MTAMTVLTMMEVMIVMHITMFDDDRDGVAIMMTEMKKVDFGTGGCE